MDPLSQAIAQFCEVDGIHATALDRLQLVRMSQPTQPVHGIHRPAVCIVAQGRKQVMLGDAPFTYGGEHCLVVSVDLPIVGHVIEATPELPYLCLRLELDSALLSEIIMEMRQRPMLLPPGPGIGLALATADLRDAATRLVRTLSNPRDVQVLAPMIEKEILYRLLTGEQAARLQQIALGASRMEQVSRAIVWIRENFDKPFSIEVVASEAGMSASSLHEHFKQVTSMSPLQYQKQLRLQEARRLILSQSADAATAGHRVGYDSPSQFSREYARLFGAPPLRDVARLKSDPDRFAEA
ncbi:AraC family transcriptional regulator [Devosia nitrariae]|nr:AraC family transcriptional regulator [Devosia nitrariae]